MTWERPGAWMLLLLAVPIVVLHLRWRRRRVADVSSLAIWRQLLAAQGARRGFRRVTENLQLAMLLAALAAFTAALAGPVTGTAPAAARRLVVVLDVSASMNAEVAAGRTRFAAAIEAAENATVTLGAADEIVVWAACGRPHVAVAPTTDLAAARTALRSLAPTLETCGVGRTLELARVAAADADVRTSFLVLTDAVGAQQLRGADADGVAVGVAGTESVANAGIAGVAVGPDREIRVRILQTDGPPSPRTLALRRDGAELARVAVEPDASGRAEVSLVPGVTAEGLVEARLEPADAFAPDDVAELVLPGTRPLRIVVVAPGLAPSPFLAAALRSMGDEIAPDALVAQPEAAAATFASVDVVVAEGALPAAAPRDRPTILFAAPGPRVERPLVWGASDHPVLDGVDLAPLRIESAALVEPGPGERALVESASGPVAVAGEREGVRHLRFGFAPGATTLPLEPAFPLLVRNAVRWVARPRLLPPSLRAGEAIVTAEPLPDVDRVWAEGPGGAGARAFLVRDGSIVEAAPLPAPSGSRAMRFRGLPGEEATAVNWFPPPGFRLVPEPPGFPDAASAVASLPDRTGNADTRVALAGWCALAGAAALVAATLARSRRPAPTPAPGAAGAAGTALRAGDESPRVAVRA